MWIARDKSKDLWFFINKPVKQEDSWYPSSDDDESYLVLDTNMFKSVKWKDVEPTEVGLVSGSSVHLWIACDEDGTINLFSSKPFKSESEGMWGTDGLDDYCDLSEKDLPQELRNVSWSDKEAKEVTIKIK